MTQLLALFSLLATMLGYNATPPVPLTLSAPTLFTYTIVQQPAGQFAYVDDSASTVTQFREVERLGTVGLLAHLQLAGASFYFLHLGSPLLLTYSDHSMKRYAVSRIYEFQAVDPTSLSSQFIDLSNMELHSASAVFSAMYGVSGSLVLQTCVEKEGDPSWGRLFIVALPLTP